MCPALLRDISLLLTSIFSKEKGWIIDILMREIPSNRADAIPRNPCPDAQIQFLLIKRIFE